MGVVIGVLVGYALGSRAGPDAWSEFEEAWHTISTSKEVQGLRRRGAGHRARSRREADRGDHGHPRRPGRLLLGCARWPRRAAEQRAKEGTRHHEVRRRVQGPNDGRGVGGADHHAGR